MDFPTIVYKTPGTHACPGGTYNYKGVEDQEGLDALIDEGWFLTLPEAICGKAAEHHDDNAKPTREELETKAKELELKFDKRTSDRKLSEMIEYVLEEKGA